MPPDPTPTSGVPGAAALAPALAALVSEAAALRGDLHAAETARRRASRINLTVLGLLAAFVLLLLGAGWQTYRLTHELSKTQKQIADCSTAGGVCYEDTRARTSSAIQDIIRAEIFMAECARLYPGEVGPTYDRKLEACVAGRLAGPEIRPKAPVQPAPSPTPSGG